MNKYFLLLGGLIIVLSCENSIKDIQKVTFNEDSPDEVIEDFHVIFIDSGVSSIEIFAKRTEVYKKKQSTTIFKDSVRVNFFSKDGDLTSTLFAQYGNINFTSGNMFVQDSVRLYNFKKKQTLESEELHWNKKTKSVYTNSPVVVKTTDAYFYGDGIKTNQDFNEYTFIKPRGTINLKAKDSVPN